MDVKSSAHYQRAYRRRLRDQGLVKKEVWIRPEFSKQLSLIEKQLRETGSGALMEGGSWMTAPQTQWSIERLHQALMQAPLVSSGAISLELIEGTEPVLYLELSEFGDLPMFMTVSGEQVIAECLLWPASQVIDTAAFNSAVLRTHKYFPLSTISLEQTLEGGDAYYMFGSLSTASGLNDVLIEIETLANNVLQATEAYEEFFNGGNRRGAAMSLWSQMFNALKGGSNTGFGNNQQAIRILDDEIRQASLHLKQTKDSLAKIMAEQKILEEKITALQASITEHESFAAGAMDVNDEALAVEIAEKIVELDESLESKQSQHQTNQQAIEQFQGTVAHAELAIRRLKLQVDTIQATESVQRAQAAVAARQAQQSKRATTAQTALKAIQHRQTSQAEASQTRQALDDDLRKAELMAKLQQAGIVSGSVEANKVLDRIKKSKKR